MSANYAYAEGRGFWRRSAFAGNTYPSNREVDRGILAVVDPARDRSTFSPELQRSIRDWPSEYHLGRARHCILRPLPIQSGDRVLELGCECGALTRYLGEVGAQVVAVEGSEIRARITALRCEDLPNVKVFFEDPLAFASDTRFDWVLLIGGFEYTSMVSTVGDPVAHYIARATSFVAPSGKLVIAMENTLGLTHFNARDEPHVEHSFAGLPQPFRPTAAATIRRAELSATLLASGLKHTRFFYPFPDYKTPSLVLSEEAFTTPTFVAADLLRRCLSRDGHGAPDHLFDEPLLVEALACNDILEDLSNSFLTVASREPDSAGRPCRLAWRFEVARKLEFATYTDFVRHADRIAVDTHPLTAPQGFSQIELNSATVRHHPLAHTYVSGTPIIWRAFEARARTGTTEDFIRALLPWFCYLADQSHGPSYRNDNVARYSARTIADLALAGSMFDCTPFNLLVTNIGLSLVDQEWEVSGEVPLGWVVTRGLLHALTVGFGDPVSVESTYRSLAVLSHALGMSVTRQEVDRWVSVEREFQFAVAGRESTALSDHPIGNSLMGSSAILARQSHTDRTTVHDMVPDQGDNILLGDPNDPPHQSSTPDRTTLVQIQDVVRLRRMLGGRRSYIRLLCEVLSKHVSVARTSDRELAVRADRISTLLTQLSEQTDPVRTLDQELGEMRDHLTTTRNELGHVQRALAEANLVIATVNSSTSWRITAPIRALGLVVRRVRPALMRGIHLTADRIRAVYHLLPLRLRLRIAVRARLLHVVRLHAASYNQSTVQNSPELFEADSRNTSRRLQSHSPRMPRALVIDDRTPSPHTDAGSLRIYNLIRIFLAKGYSVVFATPSLSYESEGSGHLETLGVIVLSAPSTPSIEHHLRDHGANYGLIFSCRPDPTDELLPTYRQYAPQACVAFDTVDLHFLRQLRQAELSGDSVAKADAEWRKRQELSIAARSDCTVVVSEFERDLLRGENPALSVKLISLVHDVHPHLTRYHDRTGLVFVGNYLHQPNVDAIHYFTAEIYPRIRQRLPGTQFFIVGSNPPPSFSALQATDVQIVGHVPDLAPYMTGCRVCVSPLRYGAGVKGKIVTAMSYGLPCVGTSVAAEGMGLKDGEHILIADEPHAFADAVLRLYDDPHLWEHIAQNGRRVLDDRFSFEAGHRSLNELLTEFDLPV